MKNEFNLGALIDGAVKIHRELRLTKQANGNDARADKRLQMQEESHSEKKRYFGRVIK